MEYINDKYAYDANLNPIYPDFIIGMDDSPYVSAPVEVEQEDDPRLYAGDIIIGCW
jgi:hypothetical protein